MMDMHKDDRSVSAIVEAGEVIYAQHLRDLVETPENIGKVIDIDIDTGDFEIGDDSLMANDRLRERRPEGRFYGKRIGYNAMYTIGGSIERTAR